MREPAAEKSSKTHVDIASRSTEFVIKITSNIFQPHFPPYASQTLKRTFSLDFWIKKVFSKILRFYLYARLQRAENGR